MRKIFLLTFLGRGCFPLFALSLDFFSFFFAKRYTNNKLLSPKVPFLSSWLVAVTAVWRTIGPYAVTWISIGRCVPRAAVGRDKRGTTREMMSFDQKAQSNEGAYLMSPSHLERAIGSSAVRSLTELVPPLAWQRELWRDSVGSPARYLPKRSANSIQNERKRVFVCFTAAWLISSLTFNQLTSCPKLW